MNILRSPKAIVVVLTVISLFLLTELRIQKLNNTNAELTKELEIQAEINKTIQDNLLMKVKENAKKGTLIVPKTTDTKSNSSNITAQEEFNQKLREDCQQEQTKYNSCLIEYNAAMVEYQSCLSCKENGEFGCAIVCRKPYNSCEHDKPSSLCY